MIISRSPIALTEQHKKLIRSGWGDKTADEVIVEKMLYDSDGEEVEGYLAYPKVIDDKLPLIIWNRGGNLKEGAIDEFLASGMYGEIASWGYVVLASQYRKNEEFGGSDVNDILNLIPLAEDLPFCNSALIGMEGWSRGGMMAYRVLTLTDRIKCAVIVSGLANLQRWKKDRSKLSHIYPHIFDVMNEPETVVQLKARSAVMFADRISSKTAMLLIHGTEDTIVPHSDSVEMKELLSGLDRIVELQLIKDGDHYLRKFRKEVSVLRRNWFDKFLKK
ncbi:MAG: prolyl oligopeptidase family serine peptidase [Ignavibacteria bacterium]|nr:prolyl oligopeptidase family serine peptidase [Ignavibacteria bacterium]